MILKKRNRERMIKQISNGEIYDLQSFVDLYYMNSEVSIDIDRINKLKEKDFEKIKDTYEEYADSFLGESKESLLIESMDLGKINAKVDKKIYTNKDVEELKVIIKDYLIKFNNFKVKFDNSNELDLLTSNIYVITDFTDFEDYYFVLNYLNETGHIKYEKKETISPEKYFLKKQNYKSDNSQDFENRKNLKGEIKLCSNYMDFRYGYRNSDMRYLDYYFSLNENEFSKFTDLFHKKIIVMPTLTWFVKRKFHSIEEYTFKKSTRTTYIVLGITIFLSMFSMYYSINSNKANTEFWKDNEIVEHKNDKQMILLLNSLVSNRNNQTETIKSLTEKIEELNSNELTDLEVALINYMDDNEQQNEELIELINKINLLITPKETE